ncbi:MAG: nuclear transport factor 2 family protein [Steroidobacteraceae bacterium]
MAREQEERNLKTVEALYAATGQGDWSTAESMLTEDFFVTEAGTTPFAGVYRGRKALHDLFKEVMATGVTGLDIQQSTAGGDTVVVLLELVLGGPPEVRVPLAEVFRLRDGKVCEIKPYYFDTRPLCAAVAAHRKPTV